MTQERNQPGKPRRGTTYSVVFPTMPSLDAKASYIDIHQKQYSHDVVQITFSRTAEKWFKDIPTGLPVKIVWRVQSKVREWVGYVSHVDKVIQGSLNQPMVIHCVGASYPLKETTTRTFSNMTVPEVARTICSEFGLELSADSHPIRFSQLVIAGQSYWSWLVSQAKRIGYTLYMDGTTMHLKRFDRTVAATASSSPVLFYQGKYISARANYYDRTLHYFKVLKGDNVETGKSQRRAKIVQGIDPISGEKISAKKLPSEVGLSLRQDVSDVLFSEYRNDQVAHDLETANELAKGSASMARFNIPAKVKCLGDPRMTPFSTVTVLGTGTRTDGLWILDEVHHNIRSNGEYDIEAVILTDGTGSDTETGSRNIVRGAVGVVNITEAIRLGGRAKETSTAKLSAGIPAPRTKDKGFNKDKVRWRAGGVQ